MHNNNEGTSGYFSSSCDDILFPLKIVKSRSSVDIRIKKSIESVKKKSPKKKDITLDYQEMI
jgi:hypothetical protein